MARTYGSLIRDVSFTDPAQCPPTLYNVHGYKNGVLVDQVIGITTEEEFQRQLGIYTKLAMTTKKYDQVVGEHQDVVVPS